MDKKVIHTVFEQIAREQPLNSAIEAEGETISYAGLNSYANRLSHLLRKIGCRKGTIVNVVIPSSIEWVAAMLSVFKSGGIFLPVDLSFSGKRLTQIFRETFDGIVVIREDTFDNFTRLIGELDLNVEYIVVTDYRKEISLYRTGNGGRSRELVKEEPGWETDLSLEVTGDDSNYIFYTSGSTGEGKAILGAHAGLGHFIHWEIREFDVDASFRISQLTPPTFDASLRDVFVSLISGGTLCIPDNDVKNNPSWLLKWLETSRISLVHCVPSLFRILTRELQSEDRLIYDFGHLKYILMAGELLYAKDILNWRKIAGERTVLVNLYGPTETVMVKTFYRIEQVPANPVHIIPVGKPIANTIIAIIRDNCICNAAEIGEIYIKTPFMTKGYYKNEKLTGECFVQNPLMKEGKDIVYKTGDLGRYLPDGNIEILGRLDSQVKVNGIRIELVEIEQAMLSLDNITGVAVKTHRADDNLLMLIAYYTGEKKDTVQLRDSLGRSLIRQMIPSFFIHLDEFPLTVNGKIDKKAFPLPQDILMDDINFSPPVGAIETMLALFWKEILGLPKIGRNISFFSIGGHSLRAIQLVSRIHKEFGVNLRIADIFTHRTIRELAGLLSGSLASGYALIGPASSQPHYPLSSSQRRLWVLSQFEDSNIAYNIPGIYELEGELDFPALEAAFQSLIDRHEILRTVFKEDGHSGVRQFICPPEAASFRIVCRDLRGKEDKERQAARWAGEEIARPFDLYRGPLLRAELYRMEDNKWIFVYTMHHIISDGWSMKILIGELLVFYHAYSHGANNYPGPEPLRIHYKDYAVWQQQRAAGPVLKEHKAYWMRQFEGALQVLDLPVDKSRPAVKTYHGNAISKRIGSKLNRRIKALTREQDATLFMSLFAAVNALLYRYTGQNDIIIGTPVAGREHLDLEGQIGFYVNTLALRTMFSGEDSFKELLDNVRQVTLNGYEHQAFPFDELVDALPLQRNMDRNALFDVVVVLQNTGKTTARKQDDVTDKLLVREYEGIPAPGSKFDLTFVFAESEDDLLLKLEYNTDLFFENTITRLADHLELLLADITEQSDKPIRLLNYLNERERCRLLSEFNPTGFDYPRDRTIVDLFEEQVKMTPGHIAVVFGDRKITYQELNERSNQLADYLRKRYDIQADDLVSIKLPRSEWMIVAILGVLKSGAAYVPIDPGYPKERISYMITDSGSKVVIEEEELIRFNGERDAYATSDPIKVNKPADLAYVIYTSGTSGNPKGALIEHKNVVRLFRTDGQLFDFNSSDVWTLFHSFCFDFSVWEMYGALLSGGKLVIISAGTAKDPQAYLNLLRRERVTVLNQTPSAFYNLAAQELEKEEADLPLRYVIFGGEALSPGKLAEWKTKYPAVRLINMYGITETTVHVTYKEITQAEIRDNRSNIGSPIPTLSCYVLDQDQALAPIGVPGELYVGGEGVCRGYLNREDLTRQRFLASPFREGERLYRSGDKVKMLENGEMEYLGRLDDQVKVHGYRIELSEIESALQDIGYIEDARVIAKKEGGDNILVAYLVSREELNTGMLRGHLSQRLPVYMIPAHFVQLDKIPLTSNGKTDRKKLPDLETAGMKTGLAYEAPRNEIEEQLVQIWKEILEIQQIGIKDNFFDLGGNSIRLIKMVRAVNRSFERRLSVVMAFRLTNICLLSEYLFSEKILIKERSLPEAPVDIMEETLKLYDHDGE